MADAKEPKHATANSTWRRRRRSHSGSRLAGAGAGLSSSSPPPRTSIERSCPNPDPTGCVPRPASRGAPKPTPKRHWYSRPRPSFKTARTTSGHTR